MSEYQSAFLHRPDRRRLGRTWARRTGPRRSIRLAVVACGLLFAGAADRGLAIEMFTFFGDGSRIGLPSLEVPVEAYPGIPLRSDRIRMRTGRFARWRTVPQRAVAEPIPEPRQGPARSVGGVRIRPMEAESKDWPIAPSPPE